MRRTIITVVALLCSSTEHLIPSVAQSVSNKDWIANADISDMVIEDQFQGLRQLVNASQAKAKEAEKKADAVANGDDSDDDNTEGVPDEKSMAGDEEDELQSKQGGEEMSDEQLEAETEQADDKTLKDFDKKALDTADDFTDDQFKAVAKKGPAYVKKIKRFGAVMELLEPRARQFVNVPQARNPSKRKNCGVNGDSKSHFLTTQGSKNYIQWRTKRVAKEGNCTIKISNDAKTYYPVTPVGMKNNFFPCGRKVGYEAVQVKFPKQMVSSDKGSDFIILQFEMYTYLGTIVQCSDMLIEKVSNFHNEKCDPQCKNGGVCQEGRCRCGSMFYGEFCEHKGGSSGAFSLLIFIFVIALVAAAIGLLYAKYNLEKEQKQIAVQEGVNEGGERSPIERGMQRGARGPGPGQGYDVMDDTLNTEN